MHRRLSFEELREVRIYRAMQVLPGHVESVPYISRQHVQRVVGLVVIPFQPEDGVRRTIEAVACSQRRPIRDQRAPADPKALSVRMLCQTNVRPRHAELRSSVE